MLYGLGLACVAWTLYELSALLRAASQTRAATRLRPAPALSSSFRSARPRRAPLAAWDERGRPIFVEDVSVRGAR